MSEPAAKILVIDDEIGIRENLVAYLEDSGYETLSAENGRIGIETCRSEKPDLVLCDLRMPEVDGLEVLKTLTEESPDIPVLIVSGQGEIKDAIEALRHGANNYITKPIQDMSVLEHAVTDALEKAHLIRENKAYRENLELANRKLKDALALLEEEEQAGRQIQFQLLPIDNCDLGPYHFNRRLLTSQFLSGDFVDYFKIGAHHLGFYIADVSGHGVSSALVTVIIKTHITRHLVDCWRNKDDIALHPAEVLTQLNETLISQKLDKYLTMFYGIIDTSTNRISYSNGGHFPFPLLYDGTSCTTIGGKSLPVGLFSYAQYELIEQELPDRFVILLSSDGILETMPQQSIKEKEAHLLTLIDNLDIDIDTLLDRLHLQSSDEPLIDDITLLLVAKAA